MNTPKAETVLQGLRRLAEGTPSTTTLGLAVFPSKTDLQELHAFLCPTNRRHCLSKVIQGGHVTEQLWS